MILVVAILFTPVLSASNPSSSDSDHDGLPDGWENQHRLNLGDPGDANKDYNNDGLNALEEYKRGLDPYNRDTDNDKISNYAEVTGLFGLVTDPLNADTDGDGLTDLEELATYVCVSNQTQMDELFVDAHVIESLRERYYPYRLSSTNPDVDGDGLLDGEELTGGTSPTNVDSDGDGLTDFDEVYKYSTNPTNIDTDGDWLADREEITGGSYGIITDPNNPDTDGDSITDGEELLPVARVMIYPSKHELTYAGFVVDNAYAGEYVTIKARVAGITHEPQDNMKSYSITLKPINSVPGGLKNRGGIAHVGNPWHYDMEHDMNFIDDVFGYILKKNDIIVVTGVAGKIVGMTRDITIKTSSNDSGGSIYVLLDQAEAASRSSTFNSVSPATAYPFWSHVKLVSVPPIYPAVPGTESSRALNTTTNTNTTSSNTELQKLTTEVASLRREIDDLKEQVKFVSDSVAMRKPEVTGPPVKAVTGIVTLLLALSLSIWFIRRHIPGKKKKKAQKGSEGVTADTLPSSSFSNGTGKEWA
ncbi:MAG: binary toxin-like calcium binding domain-containing protein [Halobacteriota archaeon]